MPKQPLNLCGIFGVKKGQSGDECAICIREPAIAVCLNNARRPQTKTDLCLPRVALRSLRSGCPHRPAAPVSPFGPCGPAGPAAPVSPLDPVDLHFPSDRSLPALPCHLSAPAGLPDQHHLPVPFAGCPDRAGVTALSLITLRPLRTRGPLFPLWPGRSHHGGDSVYGLFRRYPALFR
ncbi:Uncharacterised protein [Escherichia coli]|nr:Uncharacterised protein [Escherichia coli]